MLIHEPDAIAWHDEPDWAGRDGRLAAKNRETLYLFAATAEPMTRGPGLIRRHPDTIALVELRPNTSDSQVITTIHCLLAGMTRRDVMWSMTRKCTSSRRLSEALLRAARSYACRAHTVDQDGDRLAAVASIRTLGRLRRAAVRRIDEPPP